MHCPHFRTTVQPAWRFIAIRFGLVILMISSTMTTTVVAEANSEVIRSDGVGNLRIGAHLPKSKAIEVVFDNFVADEQGRRTRVLGVIVGGQVVKVELYKGRIWRLTISEPGIKTRDGIQVGTPVAVVAAQSAVSVAIGSGADIIVLPLNQCGLAYWSSLELDAVDLLKKWDANALASLPASVTVRTIVVTGNCPQ